MQVLGISRELLGARDTTVVEGILAEAEGDPEVVRLLQGNIAFHFPDSKVEEGEILWMDPDIRAWGRKVHERLPHLLYYMSPEPGPGALALVSAAFGDPEQIDIESTEEEMEAESAELLLPILAERLLATALFAERMADDGGAIVAEFTRHIDEPLRQSVLNTVEASLALAKGRAALP
jgi:hypothetical protein